MSHVTIVWWCYCFSFSLNMMFLTLIYNLDQVRGVAIWYNFVTWFNFLCWFGVFIDISWFGSHLDRILLQTRQTGKLEECLYCYCYWLLIQIFLDIYFVSNCRFLIRGFEPEVSTVICSLDHVVWITLRCTCVIHFFRGIAESSQIWYPASTKHWKRI